MKDLKFEVLLHVLNQCELVSHFEIHFNLVLHSDLSVKCERKH